MAAEMFLILLISLHIHKTYTTNIDFISDSQILRVEDTLVSPSGTFELGFFKPGSSQDTYLGIWYKKIPEKTIVWVANREQPLTNASSGLLKIAHPGNLVIINTTNDVEIWSSNTTSPGDVNNVIAQLDDSGNLVLQEQKNKKVLWQSFDYPTDTILPGMKFGRNFLTKKEWYLSSWKSSQDPASGEYSFSTDTHSYPQSLLKRVADVTFRIAPWNGLRFSGASEISPNKIFTFNMIINETEVDFTYNIARIPILTRIALNSSGYLEFLVWVEGGKKWQLVVRLPKDTCDEFNTCGAYGSCSTVDAQRCSCLMNETEFFVPRNEKGWEAADFSGGCVRRTPLDCDHGSDGFIKYSNVKLPDTHTSWFNKSMTLMECERKCLQNCTCMAYANTDVRDGGSGCWLWFNDLIDIRVYHEGNSGQDIYVRMASSELDMKMISPTLVAKTKGGATIKIILPVVFMGVLIGLSSWFKYACRKGYEAQAMEEGRSSQVTESQKEAIELPFFSFSTIAKATASFSPEYKLGEGGFGPVYKGILEGQEIAVKRLSKTSNQGLDEFKNEVICISKLQHRNLVKLLGCSIERDEKLLIYEYMPNRSLDSFLFDTMQSKLLRWKKRFNIIKGIARGLLYLHEDSRLRIIHRDLKASNILLDLDMNPKISDFGIARQFVGNEIQAKTEKVIGTYGYMSPEYALHGQFSTKSDVFSFGVLVLEIVSGKKNRRFIHPEHGNNLIGHAWIMHSEGKSMELIDTSLHESCKPVEVLRSIEVGLLCVQQSQEDRPNMSSIMLMLGNSGVLPKPKQPAFFRQMSLLESNISSNTCPTNSTIDLTISEVIAR